MKKESSIAYLNKQAAVTFLLLLVIVLPLTAEAQERQHLTKYFDGIPVINNTYMDFLGSSNQYHYDSMKVMGVNLFWNGINNQELNFLYSKGIKLVPISTRDDNDKTYQWVHYYCDAKYTKWEAEGTDDTEDAGLYRDTEKTEIITGDKTFVRTIPFAQTSKIIYGPYYLQENKYVVKISPDDYRPVRYTADFELMLQNNDEYPHTDTTVYEMTEPICSLQVTTSKIVYRDNKWVIDSEFIIKDTLLTRGSFSSLNTFIKFPLIYTLGNVPKEYTTTKYRKNTEEIEWSGESTLNIEFKVIWLGREKYRLSVDKITVYDRRGLELKNHPEVAEDKINSEINVIRNSPAYSSTVLGWHGIDEVVSIDNFEPIRIVAGILKQQNLRLYLPMMGSTIGVWESSYGDTVTIGTNQLNRWKVLKKRTQSDNLHIWQNAYFMSPLCPNHMILNWPDVTMSLNEKLIAITALQYENAREFDNLFGVSVLTSAQHDMGAYFEDPEPFQILYNVNLALMFGAKFFDLYTYFPADSCFNQNLITCPIDTTLKSRGTYTGLVDVEYCTNQWYFTNKWYMWRDILKPRLSGLMGKTLKNLTPLPKLTGKFLKPISMNTGYDFIQKIVNTYTCTAQTADGSNDAFDLGFFTDSDGRDYFMLISRYYNSDCNPTLRIYFNQSYFQPYRNLNLKNFITGLSTTKLINQYLPVAMDKGDAVFYGVWPVVRFGGSLIANDTIKSNTTLFDDMTIKNNVKLIIDRGKYYTITDTVTLEGTGFITGAGYLNTEQNGAVKISQ